MEYISENIALRDLVKGEKMSNLIDRQDAIELINEYLTTATQIKNKDMVDALEDMKDDFVNLPSAQPEPHWIPCSERLPEEYIRVQIQMDNGWIITAYRVGIEGVWFSVPDCGEIIKAELVEAWRKLPEPYKGVSE